MRISTLLKNVQALLLFSLLTIVSCDNSEKNDEKTPENVAEATSEQKSSRVLNGDEIVQKSEASSYHYYFGPLEEVNKFYSIQRGYFSETGANENPEKPVIEIQYKPNTDSVTRIYYKMSGLPSLKVSKTDMKPMLDFVAMFDSTAAAIFNRNFETIFHYTPNGPDSNHYYNKSKGISIGVDHDLDIVREDKKTAADAYIYVSIAPYH